MKEIFCQIQEDECDVDPQGECGVCSLPEEFFESFAWEKMKRGDVYTIETPDDQTTIMQVIKRNGKIRYEISMMVGEIKEQ